MHGTVEWLPGQPLGNDRKSWSDELLGSLPNLYVYAANNPSGRFYIVSFTSKLIYLTFRNTVVREYLGKAKRIRNFDQLCK